MTTPEKIKYYRTELGLTQQELAKRMGRPSMWAAICRWERGQHAPEEESLDALRKTFLAEMESSGDKLGKLKAMFDL